MKDIKNKSAIQPARGLTAISTFFNISACIFFIAGTGLFYMAYFSPSSDPKITAISGILSIASIFFSVTEFGIVCLFGYYRCKACDSVRTPTRHALSGLYRCRRCPECQKLSRHEIVFPKNIL